MSLYCCKVSLLGSKLDFLGPLWRSWRASRGSNPPSGTYSVLRLTPWLISAKWNQDSTVNLKIYWWILRQDQSVWCLGSPYAILFTIHDHIKIQKINLPWRKHPSRVKKSQKIQSQTSYGLDAKVTAGPVPRLRPKTLEWSIAKHWRWRVRIEKVRTTEQHNETQWQLIEHSSTPPIVQAEYTGWLQDMRTRPKCDPTAASGSKIQNNWHIEAAKARKWSLYITELVCTCNTLRHSRPSSSPSFMTTLVQD